MSPVPPDFQGWWTPWIVALVRRIREDPEDDYTVLELAEAMDDPACPERQLRTTLRNKVMDPPAVLRIVAKLLGGEYAEAVDALDQTAREVRMDYAELMTYAADAQARGYGHAEISGDYDRLESTLDAFWRHWSLVTGRPAAYTGTIFRQF